MERERERKRRGMERKTGLNKRGILLKCRLIGAVVIVE